MRCSWSSAFWPLRQQEDPFSRFFPLLILSSALNRATVEDAHLRVSDETALTRVCAEGGDGGAALAGIAAMPIQVKVE
jgi:hypothetical protein